MGSIMTIVQLKKLLRDESFGMIINVEYIWNFEQSRAVRLVSEQYEEILQ
jgi:hypothetical protein